MNHILLCYFFFLINLWALKIGAVEPSYPNVSLTALFGASDGTIINCKLTIDFLFLLFIVFILKCKALNCVVICVARIDVNYGIFVFRRM